MFNRLFTVLVVTIAAIAWFSIEAYAEQYMTVETPQGPILVFYGPVEVGSSQRLDEQLTANPEITRVGMVSGGGVAEEGYRIAEVLDYHEVTAIVPRGVACLSACAVGFLGAKDYVILGVLGFHNMYIPDAQAENIPTTQLLILGQAFGSRFSHFVMSNGFKSQLALIVSYFTTPEKFIVFTSTEGLKAFFVRTGEETINDYLAGVEGLDATWLEEHLWGPAEFQRYVDLINAENADETANGTI